MLVLFDYDGVIVDSFNTLLDLCIQAQRDLGCGRQPAREDFETIETLDFESVGRLIGIPESLVPTYSDNIFSLQQKSWSVSLFPGISKTFCALALKHTIGVITASQTEAVWGTFLDVDMKRSITTVLGGESGKSKAERIELARETYSAARDETYMVGDAISDIRQGKLAGVRTVAVSWGFQNRELLAKENPDFLIDRPEQLLDVVNETSSRA